ncbi:uncharacterized protein N7482_005043 [Penicillium canariense]|uniref:L-ornithine N(5)-monooxygenase n=1 Tax=Penicillium canariense TaxID=189055 RepID=A0A9W9I784_9EURO|nr:uncharacterized protein N7482_005043 [Penicillium canariense]KAJ5166262.1 hypothetical protein N7482_005043 [Penicillium canariense]
MKRLSRAFSGTPKPIPSKQDEVPAQRTKKIVEERSVDQGRPLRVIVIGAGISGIIACIRFVQRIPNLDLCIYDKNADIGGTWFENRYPGCACDIPAHTYQATFEPNKEWSSFYATSPEIHRYWKRIVDKYGCMKYIKLKQRVDEATWDDQNSKWHIQIHDVDSGSTYRDQANILIQATGALNNWKWPSIAGLHDFKGKLLHSASWDEDYDYSNQRVAVIGNGSSGIQIVPGMLPKVAHIDHYMRSRTWVSPTFAREYIDKRGKGLENYIFTPEEIEIFKNDHQVYQNFRKEVELELQSVHGATLIGHPKQIGAHEEFIENMKRRLANKPELVDELLPSFPPPADASPQCDIVKVDATGIHTADGQHREVDAIVCATGFDTTHTPRFTIKGRDGLTLAERWKKTPETYISVATDGFPNYFICLGPNAGLGEGNLLVLIEKELDYFTECVRKMQRDNIRALAVKGDAVRRFTQYCDEYFAGTVFSSKCRSWYKGGAEDGRIVALWPGSSLHAMKVFANPRWEDFDYQYVNDNPTGWFGDGWTENEKLDKINVDYLDDDQIDFPRPVHA